MKGFWPNSEIRGTFSFRRWVRLNLLLLVVAGLISLSFPVVSLSRRLEDFYFRLRGAQPTSGNVALVLIDDSALAHYGRWPWPRKQLAQLIRAVSQSHPKAIGVDIILSEQEDEASDATLTAVLEQARNVVLPSKISSSPEGGLWTDPLPRFSKAAAALGHVQAVLDSDGLCRRIPIAEPSAEGPRIAFAAALVNVANSGKAKPEEVADSRSSYQITGTNDFEPQYLTINYRQQFALGQLMPPFTILSARDLLDGQQASLLQGKIVLIGFGATELSDRLFTPVSDQSPMPGVEVNANAVDTLLEHKQIQSLGMAAQILLLLCASTLSLWIVMWWPGGRGLLYLSVLLLAGYAASYLIFSVFYRQLQYGPFLVVGLLAAPLAQLENLIVIDRAITRGLKELQALLPLPTEFSAHRVFIPTRDAPPTHLHWKLKSLRQLQDELASLYAFDEILLETMQEALAVYALDGRLLFHNSSWSRFCEKQALNVTASIEDLARKLGIGNEFWQTSRDSAAWQEKELALKEGWWRFRAVRLPWPSRAESNAILLLAEDTSALHERDQTRAEALGFVTHELRTPLVAIQGFAELLMLYPQSASGEEAPATIFRESRRLVAMINAYLEVLRMDVGSRPLRLRLVEVSDMVNHVRQIMQPLAQSAQIEIVAEIEPEARLLNCDEPLITGALLNLVSNAVKYSPKGSMVKVQVRMLESEIEFLVQNPGPAIPAEALDRVFEPYYRVAQQADSKPGWGLGLAFVKRICEQHGGRVQVSSSASSGTCFCFIVPVHSNIVSEAVV
jgi:signal transduction histidine kinase